MLTVDQKKRIVDALKLRRTFFNGSDRGWSTKLGINPAQWSRVAAGNFHQVLSDAQWISLARQAEVNIKGERPWATAKTKVYNIISAQLKKCQEKSVSAIFCDEAGIGKTYTAKRFVSENKNAVYVDCSQVKTKQRLVRMIAKEFGVEHDGRYSNVYGDLCFYINNAVSTPLIILDEAGDLDYPAFLELKALWNATEGNCGWYMMGADGLKAKIERMISCKKVGYTEIFSRYGKKYQRASPLGKEDYQQFIMTQASQIIGVNAPEGADKQAILMKTEGSLRRIPVELAKI